MDNIFKVFESIFLSIFTYLAAMAIGKFYFLHCVGNQEKENKVSADCGFVHYYAPSGVY